MNQCKYAIDMTASGGERNAQTITNTCVILIYPVFYLPLLVFGWGEGSAVFVAVVGV